MRMPGNTTVTPSTNCARVRNITMAHKIDLGFHHHSLVATDPQRSAITSSCKLVRGGSGPLLPPAERSNDLVTCAVRGARGPNSVMVVRCLPAQNAGLPDFPGAGANDAIIGDVDTEPRPGLGSRDTEQQPTMPHRSNPVQGASMAHALKAHIPKGPLAEDAAMCEPFPGNDPGVITDEEVQAMRSGRPASNPGRFAAAQASGSAGSSSGGVIDDIPWGEGSNTSTVADQGTDALQAAGRAEEGKNAGKAARSDAKHADDVAWGEGGSNTPADDPEFIKQVVRDETLREDKLNEARAKFNDL